MEALSIGDLCRVVSTKPRDYRGTYEGIIVKITDLPNKNEVRYGVSRDGWGALRFHRENLEPTSLKEEQLDGYNDGKAYGLRHNPEIDGNVEDILSRIKTMGNDDYSIGYEQGFKVGIGMKR